MAELAAIRGAQWMVNKVLSLVSDRLVEAWKDSSELTTNIGNIQRQLLRAQAILDNASGSQIHNTPLDALLQMLRGLVYEADDVLDELDYFHIQDELEGTAETVDRGSFRDLFRDARHTTKAATKLLDFGKRIPSLLPVHDHACPKKPKLDLDFDRVDISKKMIDIVEKLKNMCDDVTPILPRSPCNIRNDVTTSRSIMAISESIEPKLFGREPAKATIIEYITKDVQLDENLVVLPIVGPGGIGKTTLTQYIYNSKEVQDRFEIRVWICVSLDFNMYRVTKEILKSIPKTEDEKNEKPQNLDQFQKLIEKRLKNKRFLLVLDDIWKKDIISDDQWKKLLIPFTKGQVKGNTILVTTRFVDVAKMVLKNVNEVTQLKGLDPEDFWKFFMACVFGHEKTKQLPEDSVLIHIGRQIVEKLKGNPLAAKTVGKLLRENLTPYKWTRVLESKEWDSQIGDYDIMPALKLSYDYLPFDCQQCFSYCALYPEDYKFSSEELICFWIGLDILCPGYNSSKTLEDIGLDKLNELINYGFFKKEIDENNIYYVMHDLLHDLALKVSSQECLHIDSSRATFARITPSTQISIYHMSIVLNPANGEDGTSEENFMKYLAKIRSILNYQKLRTLMIFGWYDENFLIILSDMFKDAQSLRVVRLPTASHPKMESIFHNFSKLLHLRYLKLESEYFPTSLSRFYHLRVLDIQEWIGDVNLTKDMANLSMLRHFLVPDNLFHSNISNVGKLQCLQELREFKVKKETNGFELRELGELAELRGSLSIRNLEEVQVNEAHEAKLLDKKRLHKLALIWDENRSNKNPIIENQILESLQPHSNLCELKITWHGGSTCPTWLGTNLSIKGLETLCLEYVDWKMLPPLGELWLNDESNGDYFGCIRGQTFWNLKRLELIGLRNFRKWVAKEVYRMAFSLMEVLIVKDCNELMELPFSNYTHPQLDGEDTATWFPKLREIEIEKCPKLVSLPPVPYTMTLCSVCISDVGTCVKTLTYMDDIYGSALEIKGNKDISLDGLLAFHNLTQIQVLEITGCSPLAESHLRLLTSLKSLKINDSSVEFNQFENNSDNVWHLSVKDLTIFNWRASGKELTQLLYHLPKLSCLNLLRCNELTGLCVAVEKQQVAEDQREEDEIVTQQCVDQKDEDSLLLFPVHLSNSLQELSIYGCPELILAPPPLHNGDEEETGGWGLQAMCSLQKLNIRECFKFLSAYKTSSSCFPFPPSLKELWFRDKSFSMSSLTHLCITSDELTCQDMWPFLTQSQLSSLSVYRAPKFFGTIGGLQEQQRSFKLRGLCTDDFSGFLVKPICSLLSSSLTDLQFRLNNEVERFTEEQEEALQLLTSLQDLDFSFCEKLQSLPKGGLPSSLEELEVRDCKKLQCLPEGLHRLTNLKRLGIWSCPSIQSLPKDGLPSSLQQLTVKHCDNENLKEQCRKLRGTIQNIIL